MRPNIIFQAPAYSMSGYGAHARDIILALWDSRKYNLSLAPTGWAMTSQTDSLPVDTMDILTFVTNNPIKQNVDFTFVHLGIPPEFKKVSKTCNIGITAGIESDRLTPGWAEGCNVMDAVIVPTDFIKEILVRGGVKVPVYSVGEGVDTETFNNTVDPRYADELLAGVSTPFNFLTGGMYIGNTPENDRKGIGKLIRLFCDAFADTPDVGLIVKSTSMNNASPDWVLTRSKIEAIKKEREFPRVYLLHGEISDQQLASLYRHPKVKAFASCTSGESWGRMVAEAAASDLPLLVTGWSGYKDYLFEGAVTYFDYDLAEVAPEAMGQGLFFPQMKWAWAKDDSVKHLLKRCYKGYTVAQEWVVNQGVHVRTKWNKKVTDKLLVDTFDRIIQPSGIVIPT